MGAEVSIQGGREEEAERVCMERRDVADKRGWKEGGGEGFHPSPSASPNGSCRPHPPPPPQEAALRPLPPPFSLTGRRALQVPGGGLSCPWASGALLRPSRSQA